MAKGKKTMNRAGHPVKAGRKRSPNMISYRDSDGKRHWKVASQAESNSARGASGQTNHSSK